MPLYAYLHRACGGLGVYGSTGATVRCHYCDVALAPGELVELHPAAEQVIAAALGFTGPVSPDTSIPATVMVRDALDEVVDRVRGAVQAAETPSARALARALLSSVQTILADRGLSSQGR